MAESAKRHEENSNIIKEIQAFIDAAIRNQGASIKTLEIQIGQMSKVFQERRFGSLPSSMETNPRDQVKSISTGKADFSEIRGIGRGPYAVSGTQHRSVFSETVPFPRRLQNFGCVDWREAQDVKILDAYDHTLPQKEKDSDFIILDIPEDDDVPLILGRPFLSTAHSKTDVFKRKISLRIGEEKLVFKSFTIIDGDDMTKEVVLDMKFCKKYASCQMIMKKFALEDKCERIMKDE
ncbi:hypothetical protein Tco_0574993 [Tanacetum coccineum]